MKGHEDMLESEDGTAKSEFLAILKDFDDAMLVTVTTDDHIRARPMRIAECDDDGAIWFVTSDASGKAEEIAEDFRCAVTCQKGRAFLSISGIAEIVRDRDKLDELWKETWRLWFPEGRDAADLCLIHVVPEEAEYWDNRGLKGLRYMLRAAAAAIRGKTAQSAGPDQHGKLTL